MKQEYREIMPGVMLRVLRTDRFKSCCFSANFVTRLTAEDAAANTLLPRVLCRGSKKYPSMEKLSEQKDALYGAQIEPVSRKIGDVQTFGVFCDFVNGRYTDQGAGLMDQCVELVGELLFRPRVEKKGFCEEFVSGEKEILKNDIRSLINQKLSYAYQRAQRALFGEQGFGIGALGEPESIDRIDAADLYARYTGHVNHTRMELFFCGDYSFEEVERACKKAFALGKRTSLQNIAAQPPMFPESASECIEQMDVAQAVLILGVDTSIRYDDTAFPAVRLLNAVLGGGTASKLFVHVREEKSLCYYTGSQYDRFQGAMYLYCGIDPQKADLARGELLRQLKACADGKISKEELHQAKKQLINQFKTMNDTPASLESYWLGEAVSGAGVSPGQAARDLSEVTAEQVAEAAKRCELVITYLLTGKGENVHERKYLSGDQ